MKSGAFKVGIIGCKGFVGSAFFEVFSSDKKYEVLGIEKDNYETVRGTKFHLLINANGNSSKPLADKNPSLDFEMNAANTLRFLNDFPCEHYVHVSTVEVYNDRSTQETTREDGAINPSLLTNYGASKYLSEQIAKKFSKSCLILRLAGMVGTGIKKGPAYDILASHKLFVSEKSAYQYLNTKDAASLAKTLVEKGKWNQIYNVVGKGSITLSDFARIAGVTLESAGKDAPAFHISSSKLEAETQVPTTIATIESFVLDWNQGKQ